MTIVYFFSATMFSMRIVTTDYYLSSPLLGFDPCLSEFRGSEVKKAPVFRIYGSTPEGEEFRSWKIVRYSRLTRLSRRIYQNRLKFKTSNFVWLKFYQIQIDVGQIFFNYSYRTCMTIKSRLSATLIIRHSRYRQQNYRNEFPAFNCSRFTALLNYPPIFCLVPMVM